MPNVIAPAKPDQPRSNAVRRMFCRAGVNAFIAFHLVAITVWSSPYSGKAKDFVNRITTPYMLFTGLWQGWDMFAPEPVNNRFRMNATVTLRDGTKRVWDFPNMEDLGLFERYQKERYRKWGHDNVRSNSNWQLWWPTAKFIARQFSDPANPPVHVDLHRHWSPVLSPAAAAEGVARSRWRHHTFYGASIAAGDL